MAEQLVELGKYSCYTTSKVEAEVIYKEIFQEVTYDITGLPEAPFIIDVGANIGLFSLFVKEKYPSSKILAFEPAPQTYDLLCRNLALNKTTGVQTFHYGLASKASTMSLTYFPNLPGNSTLHPEEKVIMHEAVAKALGREVADSVYSNPQKVDVKLERLSHFLDDYPDLKSIDLLKVDVEGAELEVIKGLDDAHWALIRNAVIETWEISGIRSEIEDLLKSKGFHVSSKLTDFDLYIVKARRDGDPVP